MWDGAGFGSGGWGGMGVGMVLFWGVVIALIVLAVRSMGGGAAKEGDQTPLQILKERYARGEIGQDEFEQKKRDLQA